MRFLAGWGLALALCGVACAAPSQPEHPVTSYGKHFAVYSSDTALASWAAQEAEEQREKILSEFRWKQRWKIPLALRVEFGPAWGKENTLVFADKEDGRVKLRRAALRRILRRPPFWLQCGMERFFSEKKDFYPDAVREMKALGRWLDLETLLIRSEAIASPVWQDVFERQAACLVLYLKTKKPSVLADFARGQGKPGAVQWLEKDWNRWIESTHVFVPEVPLEDQTRTMELLRVGEGTTGQ